MNARELIFCIAGTGVLLGAAAAGAQLTDPPPLTVPQQVSPPVLSPPVPPSLPPPQESAFEVSGRFTAQRRPRVTVLDFEDTNAEAQNASYGSSVEAMLVTFLKRKSQFVVVERQKLGTLLDEKRRVQSGMVDMEPGDPAARALLEKLDAYILGNVTVLNIPTDQTTVRKSAEPENGGARGGTADKPTRQELREQIRGPRIEIDAKLLSRFDGRIIAAAQRSGPVACLRSIIERLGIALEQEFLRPYYGKLTINLSEPENVRIFLTPILLDSALDEEKPPVELSSTVTIGSDHDVVKPWTTDPTTYTIEKLLSGWYAMRLERPGYEGMGTRSQRWEARDSFGEEEVWEREAKRPLRSADPDQQRFVVHVDPLSTETIDGASRQFVFRKKGGSLAPHVRRQYLDTDFSHTPQRVILMGGPELDLNKLEIPDEYSDDPRCDLFDELPPLRADYGKTYIASGQTFDFDRFTGGELIIENYKSDIVVPVGQYQIALWEPYYILDETNVMVHDGDRDKTTRTSLNRETLPLALEATASRPASRAILEGRDTRHRIELSLDFTEKVQPGLPVDVFTASTNIPGLEAWQQSVELLPEGVSPPVYDTESPDDEPRLISASEEKDAPARMPRVTIKTRLGLAGRLELFSEAPDPLAADLFIDRDLLKILNLLLYGQEERTEAERGGFLKAAAEVGLSAARVVAETAIPTASPGTGGAPPAASVTPPPAGVPGPNGVAAAPVQEEVTPPPPRFPRDPDELRKLLARHLETIDLLVLDPRDMVQLRRSPDVAAIVEKYVARGGALFGFISEAGDYGEITGAPLVIEAVSKPTDRFELAPGEVAGIVPQFDKKKLDVKSKRALPELAKLPPRTPWRVIAFTQGRKAPRIIEFGGQEEGGYAALWLDDPEAFRGRLGGTVPKVEETRARLEERILEWARYLMYRRYDKTGEQRRRAEDALRH